MQADRHPQAPRQPGSTSGSDEHAQPTPILLTEQEAAALLNISPRTLWNLAKTGEMPFVKIGTLKRYRRADALAYAESRVVRGVSQ